MIIWNPRRGNPRVSYGGLYDFTEPVMAPVLPFTAPPSAIRGSTPYERGLLGGLGRDQASLIGRALPEPSFGYTARLDTVQTVALRPGVPPLDRTKRN